LQFFSLSLSLCRCPALESAWDEERAQANWSYLETRLGVAKRKIPAVVARCPQLLLVSIHGRLELMIISLEGVGAERKHLATMVTSFPHTLLHSVEEKLCPLLAFLQDIGIKDQQLAKVHLSSHLCTLLKP
jgi:mTERF domain-containing protein